MSDEHLRELERRYRESPTPQHEIQWLTARLQAGDLPRPRLELAATLGYPPAQAALGQTTDLAQQRWEYRASKLQGWIDRVGPLLDRDAAARAAFRAARGALGYLETYMKAEGRPREVLSAIATWIVAPEGERLTRGLAAKDAVLLLDPAEAAADHLDDGGPYAEYVDQRSAALGGIRAIRAAARTMTDDDPVKATHDAFRAGVSSSDIYPYDVRQRRDPTTAPKAITANVARDLVPWLCGLGDPVQVWLDGR